MLLRPITPKRSWSPSLSALGAGTYGKVTLHEDPNTKQKVAKKVVSIFSSCDGLEVTLIREISILKTLEKAKVKRVPYLLDIKMGEMYCEMYQEYTGKRFSLLHASEDMILDIIYHLLSTLTTIQSLGIVHGDIKTTNITMEGETPYLIDFGISQQSTAMETNFQSIYASYHPIEIEVIGQSDYSLDTWCLGFAVVNSLLVGSYDDVLENIRGNKWQALLREKYSVHLIRLLEQMLTVDVEYRQ